MSIMNCGNDMSDYVPEMWNHVKRPQKRPVRSYQAVKKSERAAVHVHLGAVGIHTC